MEPPAGSPKFQEYSRSWNGRATDEWLVPVASKETDSGAIPDRRLGIFDSAMLLVAPIVEHAAAEVTLTVVLCVAVPAGPVQVTL